MQVLCGDCLTVLKGLEKESVDTVYMCPSPFGYYTNENEPDNLIGSEQSLQKYVENLIQIIEACKLVLKKTGSLFIQLGDQFTPHGDLAGIPTFFEMLMRGRMLLNDRLIWYRTEKHQLKNYKDKGFLKNYEFIFHYVKQNDFYFNYKSKYARTSIHSYPIEDTYYTNEFDSGLPYQLSEMVIDTTVPKGGTISDPLCGSAKVGVVAKRMNRDFIGIDINPETVNLCKIRLGLD